MGHNVKGAVAGCRFLGTYWGQVSTPFCSEVVESCDAYLFAGAINNDYSSVGYSLLIKKEKTIEVSSAFSPV